MLRTANIFYHHTESKKKWYGSFTVQCICKSGHVVIWDDIIWFTKIRKSELKLVEEHEEDELAAGEEHVE